MGDSLALKSVTLLQMDGDRHGMDNADVTLETASGAMKDRSGNSPHPEAGACLVGRLGWIKPIHIPLKRDRLWIGSLSSQNEKAVRLDHPFLSRDHLAVYFKDGRYFICDKESKNGTQLNGQPLDKGRERPLNDRDQVELAHVLKLTFYAKAGDAPDWRKMLLRAAVLGISLAACLVLYGFYQWVIAGHAGEKMREAQRQAEIENFSRARAYIGEAKRARDANTVASQIAELERNVSAWEGTWKLWQTARTALSGGDWKTASQALGQIQSKGPQTWTWDPRRAPQRFALVSEIKQRLDFFLNMSAELTRAGTGIEQWRNRQKILKDLLERWPESDDAILARLKDEMLQLQTQMVQIDRDYAGYADVMDRLKRWPPPDRSEIFPALEKMERQGIPYVRDLARKTLPPLRQLFDALDVMKEKMKLIRDLKFADAQHLHFVLPGKDDCLIDARLTRMRDDAEKSEKRMAADAQIVENLIGKLQREAAPFKVAVECFAPLSDPAICSRILACDSLQYSFPARNRKQPIGEYDRWLGAESFWEFLGDPAAGLTSSQEFLPGIVQLRQIGAAADDLIRFMEARDFDRGWMKFGSLNEAYLSALSVRRKREELARFFVEKAAAREGEREGLISAGLALLLSPTPGEIVLQGKPVTEWMAIRLQALRRDLSGLDEEYGNATPERQKEIREIVLRRGIPMIPTVKKMWIQNVSGGMRP